MDWTTTKQFVSDFTVSKDALHIYAAFAIQVFSAAMLRRPLSSLAPWTCVLAVAVLNEIIDTFFAGEASVQAWQVLGAAHDMLNTMFLPTALLLLCRFAPNLFERRKSS